MIGETGWQGVRLGGHDAVGEAYVDFQKVLKTLSVRGIALGVVSKNTEAVALEAFVDFPLSRFAPASRSTQIISRQ